MPRIAEIKEIDGGIWCRVEIDEDNSPITLYTAGELRKERSQAVKDFLIAIFEYHVGDW